MENRINEPMTKSMSLHELEMYMEKLLPEFHSNSDNTISMYAALGQRCDMLNERTVLTPELIDDLKRINSALCLIQEDIDARMKTLYRKWLELGPMQKDEVSYISFLVSIKFDKDEPIYTSHKDIQNLDSDYVKMFILLESVWDDFFSRDYLLNTARSDEFGSIYLPELTVPDMFKNCDIPFCRVMLDLLWTYMISYSDIIRIPKFESEVFLSIGKYY